MKQMVFYVALYLRAVSKGALLACTLYAALLIFCNYYFNINGYLRAQSDVAQFAGWTVLFTLVFCGGYLLQSKKTRHQLFQKSMPLVLFLSAPVIFAWKMTAQFDFAFTKDLVANQYWNQIVYWPLKLTVVLLVLLIIWRNWNGEQSFYGTSNKGFNARPYFVMLLLMVPMLALAATQPDFLAVYPKLKSNPFLANERSFLFSLLYELAYGSDFITIELFFRGFLILAFAKWFGKDAVLPMALFYCTIHFGKPLGECISSYLGGIILGAITLQTRSIWGGLMVHLGIAWLMELFGALGHVWIR